jgi:hypothetical protein
MATGVPAVDRTGQALRLDGGAGLGQAGLYRSNG